MKYKLITGLVFLVCLCVIMQTLHADKRELHKINPAIIQSHQATAVNHTQAELDSDQPNEEEQQTTASSTTTKSSESINKGILYHVNVPVINLRHAPDINATIMTTMNHNERITIFKESYGWGKTYYQDEEVWVALHLLDKVGESTDRKISKKKESTISEKKINRVKKEMSKADSTQLQRNNDESLAGYHFVIDPGHGGRDAGAIRSGVHEKTLTLSTAKKAAEQLRQKGASVTLTRDDDTEVSLIERAEISNSTNADAFISLHYNASKILSARGVSSFHAKGDENQKLASLIQSSIIEKVHLTDNKTKQADYRVLRENTQLAVLMELGFISNPTERKLIQTDSYQQDVTEGVVSGLEKYFK